jgi:hypothetical protein
MAQAKPDVDWAARLLVPTLPSAILLLLGGIDLFVQAKELKVTLQTNKKTTNPCLRELQSLEATSRFLEEACLDILTLVAATMAINWLHRSGLKPLAWLCITLPLALITITIMLHIKRLKKAK